MAETKLLRQKIEVIRPPDVLKPGAVMVAILRPHKTPTDDIDDVDILWIKCPGSKPVATLLKAYRQHESELVEFIQSSNVLRSSQLVASLITEDRLCIIEAVLAEQVETRLHRSATIKTTSPLRDITKNAVNQKVGPSSIPALSQTASSQASKSPAPVKSSTPTQIDASRETVKSRSHPDVQDRQTPIFRAWADFVFERREYLGREMHLPPREPRNTFDNNIIQEWQGLSPQQRQFFVDRIRKLGAHDSLRNRAFWSYYYEIFDVNQRLGSSPHLNFETTVQFYDKVLKIWNTSPQSTRAQFFDRVLIEPNSLVVPSLPANSSLPTPTPSSAQLSQQISPSSASLSTPRRNSRTFSSSTDQFAPLPQQGKVVKAETNDEFAECLRLEESMPARLNISELFNDLSTEQLESGVAKGVEILSSIKTRLESERSVDSEQWLTAISNVEKQASKTKTIVGVVGATGAGKSSVINAMLDQERLVPTNCMRACTAVVTEISYNYEEVPYRAEIEFISSQDWLKELKTSFEDLFDSNGKVSRECTNEDSESGIAYAKIKAVYPLLTKENMENTTIEKLMNHNNVKHLLGSNRSIEHEDSLIFYKKLQQYVDSKEKFSREKKTEAEKAKAKEMEYWPLIRVVRLYVKAPALATGAVIVDLPGVHDSNQARAAVAQGYLKQCTGLWIVAPINRAVDDKSAKTLLGDSFKRQLKMDGGYNSVTFICSKTDDISITEAQDSLGLDDEVAPLYARSEELRKKLQVLRDKLEEHRSAKSDVSAVADSADEQLETWEKLQEELEMGKTVYVPQPENSSKKRKRSDSDTGSRKKSKYSELSNDDDFIDDDGSEKEDEDENAASEPEERGKPLTAEMINEKISALKNTKKEARREKGALEQTMKELRAEISEITQEQDKIDAELSGKCIRGRNEYSRGAIQQDFAAGIRELDQEIAEEEDAANFNPEIDARDYDVVAKSLPVFCVSSRGYQKIMGRLKKDKTLSSFTTIEETEIPALQAHCTKLTVTNRETACKRFLNTLSQLLNSLRLWSSSDGSGANLTDGQLKREAEILNTKLRRLDTAFEKEVRSIFSSIVGELRDHLYDAFPLAVTTGKNQAIQTQARWGAPVDRANRSAGGLYWATYKAVVRRDGTYSNNHFNDDLIEPVIKHVASGWEKVFSRRLPQTLSNFANACLKILTTFHKDVEQRAIKNGSSIAAFQMLHQQLSTYKETAKDASTAAKDFMVNRQKDINREFVPTITDAMHPAYEIATDERGPGSYKRMKEAVEQHVNQVKHIMFQASVDGVRRLLQKMLEEAEEIMLAKVDEIVFSVRRDYESVIIGKGRGSSKDRRVPRQQRIIRKEVLNIVESVELAMKRLVGLEPLEEVEQVTELTEETEPATDDAAVDQDVKMEDEAEPAHSTAQMVDSVEEPAGPDVKIVDEAEGTDVKSSTSPMAEAPAVNNTVTTEAGDEDTAAKAEDTPVKQEADEGIQASHNHFREGSHDHRSHCSSDCSSSEEDSDDSDSSTES